MLRAVCIHQLIFFCIFYRKLASEVERSLNSKIALKKPSNVTPQHWATERKSPAGDKKPLAIPKATEGKSPAGDKKPLALPQSCRSSPLRSRAWHWATERKSPAGDKKTSCNFRGLQLVSAALASLALGYREKIPCRG